MSHLNKAIKELTLIKWKRILHMVLTQEMYQGMICIDENHMMQRVLDLWVVLVACVDASWGIGARWVTVVEWPIKVLLLRIRLMIIWIWQQEIKLRWQKIEWDHTILQFLFPQLNKQSMSQIWIWDRRHLCKMLIWRMFLRKLLYRLAWILTILHLNLRYIFNPSNQGITGKHKISSALKRSKVPRWASEAVWMLRINADPALLETK